AYAALSGVPAPDYTFPVNNFFTTGGDTLNYASSTNTLTFTSGQLPVNGSNSLNRAYNQSTFFTAVNSPTNFAGASGTVPEPAAIGLLALGIIPLLRRS